MIPMSDRIQSRPPTIPTRHVAGYAAFTSAPEFRWGCRGGREVVVLCDGGVVALHSHVRPSDLDAVVQFTAEVEAEIEPTDGPYDLVVMADGRILALIHNRPGECSTVTRFEHPAELRAI